MLRSMTGQGHASQTGAFGTLSIELRTVNHRGYKLTARLHDRLNRLEPRVDALVRQHIRRGAVHLAAGWQRTGAAAAASIDQDVIAAYYRQLDGLREQLGCRGEIDLARLATLPGALREPADGELDEESLWELLSGVLQEALASLNAMRDAEGAAMQRQLETDLQQLVDSLGVIRGQAPQVVAQYRDRLRGKIEAAMQSEGLSIEPPELIRELQIFADRSDISEEITRLNSHIALFRETIGEESAGGRKLDFVIQEMLRETNTIGSKAGDAVIAHQVVEIKCALERMRELVQNVE
jgi:uncharacterized protein (TIGR00255 family)